MFLRRGSAVHCSVFCAAAVKRGRAVYWRVPRDGVPGSSRPSEGFDGDPVGIGEGPVRTPDPTSGLSGVRRVSGGRAHDVRHYIRHTNNTGRHGGLCRAADSATTIKSRGQVEARQAERQRMFIVRLKTGDAFRIPLSVREPPPPRPKLRSKATHQSVEGASRLGVLRGERIRAVPP